MDGDAGTSHNASSGLPAPRLRLIAGAVAFEVVVVLRGLGEHSRVFWVVLALCLAVGWSMSGLIFRQIEDAEASQIVFYRGISLSTALMVFVLWHYRSRTVTAFRALGPIGWLSSVTLGGSSVFYLYAVKETTIANIAFLNAAVPFIAGGLAWLLLREGMSRLTIAACGIALCGIAVMAWEGFAVGTWFGNLMALTAVVISGVYAVAIRKARGVDLVPAVAVSGYLAALMVLPLLPGFAISLHDLAFAVLQGVLISGLCNGLYTICARHLPAAELTLLSLFESVLSPLWVWLVINEVPSELTMVGGAIVLSAVAIQAFWQALLGVRKRQPAA